MILFFMLFILPAVALVSLIAFLPLLLINRRMGRRLSFQRNLSIYTLIGIAVSLLYLTIFWFGFSLDFNPETHFLNLRPFIWVTETYRMGWDRMVEQLLLNIAMFIPLGLVLPMVFPVVRRWNRTLGCVLAVTVSIECFQYFVGRSADVDDVIMNALGGLIGYLVFTMSHRMFADCYWWLRALGLNKENYGQV